MRYIKQFLIILAISFAGELLNHWIPLPIPASIYGLVILFVCLQTKLIKLEQIRDAGKFLIEIMPIMFIPAAVGLMTFWDTLRENLAAYLVIILLVTCVVMVVSGLATQAVLRHGGKKEET